MLDETTKGIFTITATPFLPNGELDFHSLEQMVNVYIEKGATGLTILGMMGETDKLSSEESIAVIKSVTKHCNVPVIVGVSALGQIPFVLQDFPLATGVIISSSVILKIVEECANCAMLKHEDWPGLEKSHNCERPRMLGHGAYRSCAAMAACICSKSCCAVRTVR
jgi:4-hydroxy-tetrahydrodipicolinate synthase